MHDTSDTYLHKSCLLKLCTIHLELQDSEGDETSGGSISSTAIIATALAMVVALSLLTIIIVVALCMKRRPSVRDGISKSVM